MIRSKSLTVTTLIAACGVLSACGSSQPDEPSPSSYSEVSTTSASEESHTSSSSGYRDEECVDSEPNPLFDVSALPIIGNEQQELTFSVTDDRFDPCASLSWSVISGGVGTGSSQRQGVVFFHAGKPIVDPAPLMQEKVTAVTPVGNDSVTVSYEILDGPRAAAQTIPGSATFTLNQKGTLEISDNTLPPIADEAGIQLDVNGL